MASRFVALEITIFHEANVINTALLSPYSFDDNNLRPEHSKHFKEHHYITGNPDEETLIMSASLILHKL